VSIDDEGGVLCNTVTSPATRIGIAYIDHYIQAGLKKTTITQLINETDLILLPPDEFSMKNTKRQIHFRTLLGITTPPPDYPTRMGNIGYSIIQANSLDTPSPPALPASIGIASYGVLGPVHAGWHSIYLPRRDGRLS